LILVLAVPSARALTPTQSTAAAMKAKADALARIRVQTSAKTKADAAAKARVDAAAKTKFKFQALLNVRAETKRRVEAATKAAEPNAQVSSFRATSSPTASHKLAHLPGKLTVGPHHHPDGVHDHHHEGDHDHSHGAATEHAASSGHAH